MVFDDFFQNVPNHRVLLLYQLFSLLNGGAMPALFQAMIDERLEQLERHLLGQPALMQLQLRTYDDYGTAGIIHALAQQILAEASLLAFQGIRQRFERPVV